MKLQTTLRPWRILAAVAAATLVVAAGCGSDGGSGSGGASSGAGAGPVQTTTTVGEGLPCDVADVLAQECAACHSDPPTAGSPMSLLSYDDLAAPALSDPSKTMAAVSLERMLDMAAPMPPGAGPTPEAVAVFDAWLAAGMPQGDPSGECEPTTIELTCTSGSYWTDGDDGDDEMHPGGVCIGCHEGPADGPNMRVAGTVYPSAHEDADCNGLSGVMVEIIDAEDRVYEFETNAAGNFFLESEDHWPVTYPIRASVSRNGETIVMQDPVEHGDCNGCHTATGAQGAPGRIIAP
jgi:hypothetical protein